MMKICCTCQESKALEFFCKNKNTSDGYSAQCKYCAKQYRELHKLERNSYPSSSKEYRNNYYEQNKEHINELRRDNYNQDIELSREKARLAHQKNPEIKNKSNRKRYKNNKSEYSARNKIYRQNNKESIYLRNRKRRKMLESENITQNQINDLLKLHNFKCFYCNIDVYSGVNLHLDHKIPLSKNGAHTIDNLVPSCKQCNLSKGTKTDAEFLLFRSSQNKDIQ